MDDSLNSTVEAEAEPDGNPSDLKPKKLIFKERSRITIVTSARGTARQRPDHLHEYATAHRIGFIRHQRHNPHMFLLTANKDEDAEQQRGAERPTGHPGVERYVDSASS